jgi:hypothetical protein
MTYDTCDTFICIFKQTGQHHCFYQDQAAFHMPSESSAKLIASITSLLLSRPLTCTFPVIILFTNVY